MLVTTGLKYVYTLVLFYICSINSGFIYYCTSILRVYEFWSEPFTLVCFSVLTDSLFPPVVIWLCSPDARRVAAIRGRQWLQYNAQRWDLQHV